MSVSPGALAMYPLTLPHPHQWETARAAYRHAAQFLTLPPFCEISFHAAPLDVPRGLALHDVDARRMQILLRSDLWDSELVHVMWHEAKHASDMHRGLWSSLPPSEREARAERFANQVGETFRW